MLATFSVAQDDPASTDLVRAEFRAAYGLARAGLPALGRDSEGLRNYAIYPYLEAARLGRAATQAEREWGSADDDIGAFLTRHDSEPVARDLRIAWLQSLARRELWSAYLEQYRPEAAGASLRCRYLAARIALGDAAGIASLIRDEWLTALRLPPECEPVFQWARDQGVIDDGATEARVRLLLENGQAAFGRIIARRLPEARARPLLAWADLIERPLETLVAYVDEPSSDLDSDMLLDGFSRLARDNPDAALGLYDVLIATLGLGPDGESPYARAIALGLSWDRRPQALDYFTRIAGADLDDYVLEWRTRAALWAGDWDVVRGSIAAMSEALRDTAQWRYWAARASSDRRERERLYQSIVPDDNYYAAVAAAELRDRAEPHPEPVPADPRLVADLMSNPALLRAAELWQVGLAQAAVREWRHGSASLDPTRMTQRIHLAMDLGWYDLAVATATEVGIFNDYALLYPRPYDDDVEAAADEFDLDPLLIYAVMRQESLYRADAESSAGALGLMQLRPGTAEGIAARVDAPASGALDLLDPTVNVRLGAAELKRLLERYDGQIAPALAAYNAGPAAADRWLPPEPMAGDIWLENVPYNETREYVRRVLWHRVVFEWLESGRGADTRDWLDTIEPNRG